MYCVQCRDCPAVYYGQTKNWLGDRLRQHKNNIRKQEQSTALSTHATTLKHVFNFDDVRAIDREANLNKRLTLKALHIKNDKRSINFRMDLDNINMIYDQLF